MKGLVLSRYFHFQQILSLMGLLLAFAETLLFLFIFVADVFICGRYHQEAAQTLRLILVGGIGVSIAVAAYCFVKRQFLKDFGRWEEGSYDEDFERRKQVTRARQVFMEGNFAKGIQILDLYLKERPDDTISRRNMASCLALDGQADAAKLELETAGDPRKLIPKLKSDHALERAQKVWPLLSGFGGLLLFGLVFVLEAHETIYTDAMIYLHDHTSGDFSDVIAKALSDQYDVSNLKVEDFKRAEDTNFVFYYHDPKFLNDAQEIADRSLSYDLDFFKLAPDWFSRHKITMFLTDSKEEYMKRSPFALSWEGGCAYPEKSLIYLYQRYGTDGKLDYYFTVTMAHELCHICYYQINKNIAVDTWLNEGLANFNGYNYFCDASQIPAATFVKENVFDGVAANPLSFDLFLNSRPQELPDTKSVNQFYNQGYSMVYVLIQYYGKDAFIDFLHEYSESKDMNAALAKAYPSIHGLNDLEGIWSLFMKQPSS